MKTIVLVLMLLFVGCSTLNKKNEWVQQSNNVSEQFTKNFSQLYPELGSGLGYQEFDKLGVNPGPANENKEHELLKQWKIKLNSQIQTASSKNLKVDLLILLDNVDKSLKWFEVNEKLGAIPVAHASETVYNFLFQLVNDQSPTQRKAAAVDRFKYYMSETGKQNIVRAYWSEITRHQSKFKTQKKFYPFNGELKKYLADSESYVKGVKGLLEKSGRTDWEQEYKLFVSEIKLFDKFITDKILPQARKQPNLPREIYVLALEASGVEAEPEKMISVGENQFQEVYKDFAHLAKKLAEKYNLKKNDPASVIQFLKSNPIVSQAEVSKLYNDAADRLERIIQQNNLVTLPAKKLKIRLAGDAESKASPVPHLNPPPLINNNGIVPEFVVPTSSTGQLPFDDFSFASAATVLTAHEGRPGHDLQFSKMLENQVSIIRARYAMNSVNVEGWALYAEDLVYPYLTDEEKFIALQTRLWRIARYFLDPMVQLGKANQKKVFEVFNSKLGVSKVMAGLEYDRYAFRSPGQATSYYHGLLNIIELKSDLTKENGPLNLKCFNDTLLTFGLLPHKEIRLFKEDFKTCAQ